MELHKIENDVYMEIVMKYFYLIPYIFLRLLVLLLLPLLPHNYFYICPYQHQQKYSFQ